MPRPLVWSYSALSAFQKCPKQYHEVRVLKKYKSESFAQSAGNLQHKAFENVLKKDTPLPESMAHHRPMLDAVTGLRGIIHAEMKLALNTRGEACDFWDDEVWVRGAADVLIEQEKQVLILDWKGGKSRYADTTQLKLTALMAFAKFPQVERAKAALVFTAENKTIPMMYERTKQREYWEQILPDYSAMVRAHESGNFIAKSSGLCRVCPVKTCPHNRSEN